MFTPGPSPAADIEGIQDQEMKRESSKRRESSGSFQLVTISGPIKWWTVSHVIVSNNQCCEQECSNSKDLNNKSWFNGVKIV